MFSASPWEKEVTCGSRNNLVYTWGPTGGS